MYIWHLHKKYKIYIHNRFFFISLVIFENKNAFWEKQKQKKQSDEVWYIVEYCSTLVLF